MKKALVLSLAVVLGLGMASFAQELTGKWVTTFTIDPTVPTITIASDLDITYTVGAWDFTTSLGVTGTGLDEVTFGVLGTFGGFTLTSSLEFDPLAVAFKKWTVGAGVQMVLVDFSGTFTLYPNDVQLVLVATNLDGGPVDATITLTFGTLLPPLGNGCDLDFAGVDIAVTFPFCCADVTATIRFDCTGFLDATFGVTGIALPGIDWLTLDALLTFTTTTKTLELTPTVDFGAVGCFNFYFADVTGGVIDGTADLPIGIGAFDIVGLGIGCEIGGVLFEGLSYWGDTGKPTWLGDYWEGYKLSTTDDGCCGIFNFSIAVFFDPAAADLFTLAAINAAFDIDIAEAFNFGMTLDLDLLLDTIAWGLVFTVTW